MPYLYRKFNFILAICLVILSLPLAATKKTAPKLAIELFTKAPYTRQVEISPDGKHIAFIYQQDNQDMLAIMRLSDMKVLRTIYAAGKRNQIGEVFWANNERLLYNIVAHIAWDKQKYFNDELYGVNINGKKHKAILGHKVSRKSNGKYGSHQIIDFMPNDKKHILIAFYPWRDAGRYFSVNNTVEPMIYKLNIYSAKLFKINRLATPRAKAFVDNNHQVRLSFALNDNNIATLHHRANNDAKWQPIELKGLPNLKRFKPIGFHGNNQVYLLVDEATGPDILYLYDLTTDKAQKIYQHQSADIQKWVFDLNNHKIVAVRVELGYPEYFMLEKQDSMVELHKKLLKKASGFNIDVTSYSSQAEKVIVRLYSDYQDDIYFLYNNKTDEFNYLMHNRKWLEAQHMAIKKAMTFKARDGLTLNGYLTRPVGKAQSLPTVILPHGGPHGVKDSWAFDWEVQLLANQGYAVLQLNYRGSSGYGYEFEKAGYGQWGAAMQDDLTDATKQLIENGISDKNRICIYGASYGGYAALMGVIREPELYRCAIGSMGVYSLPIMFTQGDISDSKSGLNYLRQILGNDQNRLKAYSPAYNTEKIQAPLLLIHGEQDNRAPIEQFEALEQGLKANNKPYEKIILDDEGHGYYDPDNRLKIYRKIIAFLNKHIGQ